MAAVEAALTDVASQPDDATLVRIVLVPATMRLLGDWNWWLPGWLDRLLPNVNVEGRAGLPEPAYELAPPREPHPALAS